MIEVFGNESSAGTVKQYIGLSGQKFSPLWCVVPVIPLCNFADIEKTEKLVLSSWGLEYPIKSQVEKLRELVKQDNQVRVWLSRNNVAEYCALLFTIHCLRGYDVDINVIYADEYSPKATYVLHCFEEMKNNDFSKTENWHRKAIAELEKLQKKLTSKEILLTTAFPFLKAT